MGKEVAASRIAREIARQVQQSSLLTHPRPRFVLIRAGQPAPMRVRESPMRLTRRLAPVLTAAAMLASASGLGLIQPAAAATVDVGYALYLAGLPIGSAEMKGTFEGRQYRLEMQARLSGLGAIIGGEGGATASGSLTTARPTSSGFAARARTSAGERTLRMAIVNGNAVAVSIDPPLEPKLDKVPVAEAHKRAIIDPLSAVIAPVVRGALTDPANCNRTVPIFDGGTRFDMVLSYAGTRQVEKPGYSGPVLVCNVRYVPIAGHRPQRPATRFMQDNRDISVWLAPVEGARVLVPLRISLKTMIGTSVVEATHVAFDGPQVAHASGRRLRRPKTN
jgi:Protein of unknown function (DUF3108)